jgi:Starch binding domain/GDSL-like Lipase/Acylhydrolase family/Putative papain-like cysteine peptidase (DUF1796)
MYRFQINAPTQAGESIALVGSSPQLGAWDTHNCVHLRTSVDRYPLWWTDIALDLQSPLASAKLPNNIEYKYIRLDATGNSQWEAFGPNRWVSIEPLERQSDLLIVDDGEFGYLQPYPFGYIEQPTAPPPSTTNTRGLKILVLGSSVALGHKSWLLRGWDWLLGQALQQRYHHQLVNVSEVGANVSRTLDRFQSVVTPKKPDVVIIALSLGNEGLAACSPHDRRAVQRRFESGLQQLVKLTREVGAYPILGGVYPHGDYAPEHTELLWDTHNRMLTWDVPVLDWLASVEDGQGHWKPGTSFDPAHPNTLGHRLMYQSIDIQLFDLNSTALAQAKQRFQQPLEILIYGDKTGFQILACPDEKRLRLVNESSHPYTIVPSWQELQAAFQQKAGLLAGFYLAKTPQEGTLPFLVVDKQGRIETTVTIPPHTRVDYTSALPLFAPNQTQLLFYDGQLGIVQTNAQQIWIINESDHEYNIHPMWKEVRRAFKASSPGVYDDPHHPEIPFRTLMIGEQGLENRVKVPARSAVLFQYQCKLSDINRVAILPLGDRCAIRMLLYKMEYDGPAFPFDLTRTTQIADVADMIETRFEQMWDPEFLDYSFDAGRIYHRKWSGLSFAHEIEDTDDPLHDMSPVHERMRTRYTARAERFWYTLQQCDKVLFVRTGIADRRSVTDLVTKLQKHCLGKPFHLLLISPQSSDQFLNLPYVLHYDLEFNPDRMYEDLDYWLHCTTVMRGILDALGISNKNLFWCPPTPPAVSLKHRKS